MSDNLELKLILEAINKTGVAFDSIRKEIESTTDRLNRMVATGQTVSDRLSQAFKKLDIRSAFDISAEQKAVVAAFNQIKTSGVASAKEIERAADAARKKLDALGKEASGAGDKIAEGMKNAKNEVGLLGGGITALAGRFLVLELGITHLGRVLNTLVFDFNSTLETAELGIAAALMTNMNYADRMTGKVLEGEAAMKAARAEAAGLMKQLQSDNLKTIATTDQLVRAFQETLPVAMAKGLDTRQAREFTLAVVQAAGVVGVSLDMLAEETRSMLTGAIDPRTSRIATVLGLRNEDVREVMGNADALFDLLMKRLASYSALGEISQKTWKGAWSNMLDLVQMVSAEASKPLFERVRDELAGVNDQILEIDEATGQIGFTPEFARAIAEARTGVEGLTDLLFELGGITADIGGDALSDWLEVVGVIGRAVTLLSDAVAKARELADLAPKMPPLVTGPLSAAAEITRQARKYFESTGHYGGVPITMPPGQIKTVGTPKPPPDAGAAEAAKAAEAAAKKAAEAAIREAQRMEQAWNQAQTAMALDVRKLGLDVFDAKIVDLIARAETLRKEFGPKTEIDTWVQAMIAEVLDDQWQDTLKKAEKTRLDNEKKINDEYNLRLDMERELLAMRLDNNEMAASLVGGASDNLGDEYARQMAQMQARYQTEFALLDEKRRMIEDEKKQYADNAGIQATLAKQLEEVDRRRYLTAKAQNIDLQRLEVDYFRAKLSLADQYAGYAGALLSTLADTQDQSSREGFEAAKAFQVGATVVNTAGAIMNALATVQPYPAAVAAAAVAAATGAAQIAKIQSAKFGGGDASFAVPGYSGSYAAGGGGSTGASIGTSYRSVYEMQTAESLRALADAAESASLAVGDMTRALTSIGDLFAEGGISQWGLMNTPSLGAAFSTPAGLWEKVSDLGKVSLEGLLMGSFVNFDWLDFTKNMFSSTMSALKGSLFGGDWYTRAAGIGLGIEGGQLVGSEYTSQKKDGGLFSSTKRRTVWGDMDLEFEGMLADQLDRIVATVDMAATIMGTSADTAAATLGRVSIQTSGRSEEQLQEDLENWFYRAADAIAATTAGLQEFTFRGENAFDAVVRLATALQTTNEQLSAIGAPLIDSTLAGANVAFKLQELMGGAEGFADALDGYLGAVFDDKEQEAVKVAAAQREVNVSFALMNATLEESARMALPTTNAEFRALVNGLDLTTESGAALFAELMAIAPAFGEITAQAQRVADERAELEKQLLDLQGDTAALRALERAELYEANRELYDRIQALKDEQAASRAIADERAGLERQLLQLQGDTAALRKLERDAISEANRDLYDRIQALKDEQTALDAANAIISAFSNALTADVSAAEDALRDAYSAESAELERTRDKFAAYAEGLREFRESLILGELSPLRLAERRAQAERAFADTSARAQLGDTAAIETLRDISSDYLQASLDSASTAEEYYRNFAKVQAVLKNTETVADRHARIAQTQLDTLNQQVSALIRIDSSVLSVRDAIVQLSESLKNLNIMKEAPALQPGEAISDPLAYVKAKTEEFNAGLASGKYRAEDWGIVGEATVSDVLRAMVAAGLTPEEHYEKFGRYEGVPGFAAGGYHSGGLRLVGENGPELEVTGPSRIYDANKTRALLSGDVVVLAEIRALLSELVGVSRSVGGEQVKTQKRLVRYVEEWDAYGLPGERTA